MAPVKRLLHVSELVVLKLLEVDELLGPEGATTRAVSQVVPGTAARAIATLPPDTLVVFERGQLAAEDVATDLAIRLAASTGLAGIVAESPPSRAVPEATRRLAAKFGVPVVLLRHVDAADTVATLDPYVRAPEVAAAKLLRQVIGQLSAAPARPDVMLGRLTRVLGCPVALLDAGGRIISGHLTIGDELPALLREQPEPPRSGTALLANGDVLVLQPAVLSPGAAMNLWLGAQVDAGCDLLTDAAQQALAVAAVAFTAHIALNEVGVQRAQRDRALLLGDILQSGGTPSRAAVEHATALGWGLWGWQVGVHVVAARRTARSRSSELDLGLERVLVESGLAASPIARADATVFWITSASEPTADELADIADRLHRALFAFERQHAGLATHAGLGRPHTGIDGIAQSLQEAQDAAALALTSDGPAPVNYVGALNAGRLVADWYSAGPLREIAERLISPLWNADPTGELVRTLGCYLDHESSATAAAASLHIHRNTVLYRLGRIRELLNADLDQCDDRLAIHLAARASLTDPPALPTG